MPSTGRRRSRQARSSRASEWLRTGSGSRISSGSAPIMFSVMAGPPVTTRPSSSSAKARVVCRPPIGAMAGTPPGGFHGAHIVVRQALFAVLERSGDPDANHVFAHGFQENFFRMRCVERSGLDPRIRSRLHGYVLVADEPRYALHQVGDGGDLARAAPYAKRSEGQVVGLQGEIQMAFSRVRFA